jgi:hypothetical protein
MWEEEECELSEIPTLTNNSKQLEERKLIEESDNKLIELLFEESSNKNIKVTKSVNLPKMKEKLKKN